jgi:hypothetical protein
MAESEAPLDFAVWLKAPKERTVEYFPIYSQVSRALQAALREWVREWFYANPEILVRYHTAYQILVYFCTHPFRGRPANRFTYDLQRTEALALAFTSAASKLKRELKAINTRQLAWEIRERYFPYRYREVVEYVRCNHHVFYQMLNVDTMLMDAVLKFAIIDVPNSGLEYASRRIRGAFAVQLHRFSDEFDLSARSKELLLIATDELARASDFENFRPQSAHLK